MAEALLDDLEVGAAGEEPGGVGVAEVVDPHPGHQVRRLHGRVPDGVAEPVRRDVPVRVTRPHTPWLVLAVRTAGGPVAAVGIPAVIAAAAAKGVAGQRAVPVAVPSRIRLSAAQGSFGLG